MYGIISKHTNNSITVLQREVSLKLFRKMLRKETEPFLGKIVTLTYSFP